MGAIKVVLCASDMLTRSVREITLPLNDIEICFCAPEADMLIEMCKVSQPTLVMLEKQPDVAPTIALLDQLRAERLRHDIIIIAHEANVLHARYLLNEGVKGYLLVSSLYEDFATSLRLVAAGKTVLSPLVAQVLLTAGS